ncbi:MAG: FHA domain-containing protein [Spirochaetes bacterium]|nr:FHA domain-containing protein [Spirochaetota bacterium]
MSNDNIFNQQTGRFKINEDTETQKRAKINAKSSLPRLEVRGQYKTLSNKAFGIGRDKSNQLIIADTKVSRYHAFITFEDDEAYIKDTDSANGTYINDVRIPSGKKIKLKNGDKIKVGTTVIGFTR